MRRALPFFLFAIASAAALSFAGISWTPVRVLLWTTTILGAALGIHELLGKPVPFLRWSFIRVGLGMKKLLSEWQVGDGREEGVARHVVSTTTKGDLDGVIKAVDEFAYQQKFLMNVGDKKGALLDDVIRRTQPGRVLELGAYVGYSALRIARLLPPGGHVYSVEWSEANAQIARRIVAHAGAEDRVTILHGSLGDDEKTMTALREQHGFGERPLDVVFIDHDKNVYVPDFERILAAGWLRPGSVVMADNILFPGAPEYRAFIEAGEGKRWSTRVHETHVEYQSVLPDIVLESTILG